MVLLLISIIIAISSVSLVSALNSSRLEATAQDVSSALRRARAMATLKGQKEDVLIDLDSKAFGIENAAQGGFKSIPEGVNVAAFSTTGEQAESGAYRITFFPSGAVEGGAIIIWNNKRWFKLSPDPVMGCVESSGLGGLQ